MNRREFLATSIAAVGAASASPYGSGPAGARQRYMFHCHNLEHEDGMMMRNFAVV